MHVAIVGSGYVGTTVSACLADLGHEVVNVEIDEAVVAAINAGESPIHEPGLQELVATHAGGDGPRLRATTDYAAVREAALTILCLPTPSDEDGTLELGPMRAAARSLGEALAGTDGHLVVVKSTVLPGTTTEVVGATVAEHAGLSPGEDLELAMNPEFLRMGSAVADFMEPDKVVVGTAAPGPAARLRELYAPILERPATTLVETGIPEAELIKYANNAALATKVSLVNEIGNVAKAHGIDGRAVLEAVGLDDRISARFMRPGLGWGGSCFPKDVDALRAAAREAGYEPVLLDAAVAVNDGQPRRLVELLERHLDPDGARITVLGLAFKPHTDDVRSSRALAVIELLRDRGATVVAHDPVATENARAELPAVTYADSLEDALAGADGAVVATAWPAYDDLPLEAMDRRVLVDGRGVDVDRDRLAVYEGLTW